MTHYYDIMSLQNQVNNVQLRVDNLVSQNAIEKYDKVNMSEILIQKSYFNDAITEQQKTFNSLSIKHRNLINEQSKDVETKLNDIANDIVTDTITKISSNQYVINKMQNDMLCEVDNRIKIYENDNIKIMYSIFIMNIISCLCSCYLMIKYLNWF